MIVDTDCKFGKLITAFNLPAGYSRKSDSSTSSVDGSLCEDADVEFKHKNMTQMLGNDVFEVRARLRWRAQSPRGCTVWRAQSPCGYTVWRSQSPRVCIVWRLNDLVLYFMFVVKTTSVTNYTNCISGKIYIWKYYYTCWIFQNKCLSFCILLKQRSAVGLLIIHVTCSLILIRA